MKRRTFGMTAGALALTLALLAGCGRTDAPPPPPPPAPPRRPRRGARRNHPAAGVFFAVFQRFRFFLWKTRRLTGGPEHGMLTT